MPKPSPPTRVSCGCSWNGLIEGRTLPLCGGGSTRAQRERGEGVRAPSSSPHPAQLRCAVLLQQGREETSCCTAQFSLAANRWGRHKCLRTKTSFDIASTLQRRR